MKEREDFIEKEVNGEFWNWRNEKRILERGMEDLDKREN